MLYTLHYFFKDAGLNAISILLGVYMRFYTDASAVEVSLLYMLMPFIGLVVRPFVGSFADRHQAHRECLMTCLCLVVLCYLPFIAIPLLGPRVYMEHPRACWYGLFVVKLLGDACYGCTVTLGDSLTANYANRIGTHISQYRMGGTISWMLFGLITGQLNEIWFLPKYVAGFMILISSALLDLLAMYLWPREYFVMASEEMIANEQRNEQRNLSNPWTRTLMPKEAVWEHAKSRLRALATCSCCEQPESDCSQTSRSCAGGKASEAPSDKPLDKKVQLMTLLILLRRDPRIIGYMLAFVAAGAASMTNSFFMMSLAEICHKNDRCDFSQLAGLIQFTSSITDVICLIVMPSLVRSIGRLKTLSIVFALGALKYAFYGTIWSGVHPYYAILVELVQGFIYEIGCITFVELGHSFALQAERLIPELVHRHIIRRDDLDCQEKLKLALPATMQALFAAAFEGAGRGFGALAYGFIIDAYSYQTLWLIVATGNMIMLVVLLAMGVLGGCLGLSRRFSNPTTVSTEAIRAARLIAETSVSG